MHASTSKLHILYRSGQRITGLEKQLSQHRIFDAFIGNVLHGHL